MLRRFVVTAFAIATLLAAAPVASASGAAVSDWPQPAFDGGRSRHNTLERRLRPATVDRLRLAWSRRVRPRTSFVYEYVADVAIVRDGRVFAEWAGSEAFHVLAAYDEATGRLLWRVRTHAWRVPVAASGSVLLTSAGDSIRALDVVTGAMRWRRDASVPLVADRMVGRVVVFEHVGGARRVSAIVVTTGERAWARRLRPRGGRYASVLVTGGLVIVPVATGHGPRLTALRLNDGSTAWSIRSGGVPALAGDGRLFVRRSAPGAPHVTVLAALDLRSARRLWKTRIRDGAIVAAGGGRVFLERAMCVRSCEGDSTQVYRGGLIALDSESGVQLWRRLGDEGRGRPVWQAGAVARGLLFVHRLAVGGPDEIGALSVATGRLRWSVEVGGRRTSATVDAVANGAVFVGTRFGTRGGRIGRFSLPARDAPERTWRGSKIRPSPLVGTGSAA